MNQAEIPTRAVEHVSTSLTSSRNILISDVAQRQTELSLHTADEVGVTVVGNDDQTELCFSTMTLPDTLSRGAKLLSTYVASSRNILISNGE